MAGALKVTMTPFTNGEWMCPCASMTSSSGRTIHQGSELKCNGCGQVNPDPPKPKPAGAAAGAGAAAAAAPVVIAKVKPAANANANANAAAGAGAAKPKAAAAAVATADEPVTMTWDAGNWLCECASMTSSTGRTVHPATERQCAGCGKRNDAN